MNKSMKRFLSFMMAIAVVATTVFGPDVTTAYAKSLSTAVKSVTLKTKEESWESMKQELGLHDIANPLPNNAPNNTVIPIAKSLLLNIINHSPKL